MWWLWGMWGLTSTCFPCLGNTKCFQEGVPRASIENRKPAE